MNKSRFIQGFAFVLFTTTAALSFGTEPQKTEPPKEEQQSKFSWSQLAAEYWLPATAILGTWLFKSYLYDSHRAQIPMLKSEKQTAALYTLAATTLAFGAGAFAAGVYLDKNFVKPRIVNPNAALAQMEKQTKK